MLSILINGIQFEHLLSHFCEMWPCKKCLDYIKVYLVDTNMLVVTCVVCHLCIIIEHPAGFSLLISTPCEKIFFRYLHIVATACVTHINKK